MKAVMALAGATALAVSVWAVPASAQRLDEGDREFLAEMLAMGEICPDVGVNTRYDDLADYVASRLTGQTQEDLDSVLSMRDAKIDTLHSDSDRVRAVSGAKRRENAINEYFADLTSRCYRLAENDVAGEYFVRGFSPLASY